MLILGLTGSLAMGKSHAALCFMRLGVPVFDADSRVHALYSKGGEAVKPIAALLPDVIEKGAINRALLSKKVIEKPALLTKIEHIVHPLVRKYEQQFLTQYREEGQKLVVLDIPLLFETDAEKRCDKIVVVSAPPAVQKRRAFRREGMTEEKFAAILARQMPDKEKCRRADFIVRTGLHKGYTFQQIQHIVRQLT